MIYTSYFAHYKGENGVAICLWPPKWIKNIIWCPDLAPTKEILEKWQGSPGDLVDELEYIEAYRRDVLSKLDVHEMAKELEGKTLLCYEKTGAFCHRNIVREWLNENGYECKELD
jgi:uncharacterized protein YeaO (DUF488 family)